jgi:hypothetical protein
MSNCTEDKRWKAAIRKMEDERAMQRHNTENSKHLFPKKELRGHSPNSYIHVSVSDLYILMLGLLFLLQDNRWTDRGNT